MRVVRDLIGQVGQLTLQTGLEPLRGVGRLRNVALSDTAWLARLNVPRVAR